jgi:hypothetical protein
MSFGWMAKRLAGPTAGKVDYIWIEKIEDERLSLTEKKSLIVLLL